MKRKSTKQPCTLGELNRKREMFRKAIYELAAEGLIYDTGQRRWSEQTQSCEIVWAAVPGKQLQS
jgi:hypothetical protein